VALGEVPQRFPDHENRILLVAAFLYAHPLAVTLIEHLQAGDTAARPQSQQAVVCVVTGKDAVVIPTTTTSTTATTS
jgi:hypothetical protein